MTVLTCEHAGNAVPPEFRECFADAAAREDLASHLGWDAGALAVAEALAAACQCPLLSGKITRLLIDLNRSPENRERWSHYARQLPAAVREQLHGDWFEPYLHVLRRRIRDAVAQDGAALHLSVHTFVRHYHGQQRATDIGILFDPMRTPEAAFARRWLRALREALPHCTIDENLPYAGTDDGLTTLLRREFPQDVYRGIELELCQDLATGSGSEKEQAIERALVATFRTCARECIQPGTARDGGDATA